MTDTDRDWVSVLEVDGEPMHRSSVNDEPPGQRAKAEPSAFTVGALVRAWRRWWRAAGGRTRAVGALAVLAAVLASVSAVSAALANHPVDEVERTVHAPAALVVDALGCPRTSNCNARSATAAARAVRYSALKTPAQAAPADPFTPHFANLPFTDVDGVEIYDVASPATVYSRSVQAAGTFDGAPMTLRIRTSCVPGRPARRLHSRATAALGAPRAVDTYASESGGCSISVSCNYRGLFTAGGYPYDSPEIAALVAGLARSPQIRL